MPRFAAPPSSRWHIAAAIAAWLVPGLGHYLLGQRSRGLILFVAIAALWLSGLAIGGIGVLDRRDHRAWFLAQMFISPAPLTSEVILPRIEEGAAPLPTDEPAPAYVPSFARTKEQGVLYTALAGMLNLLAILDVLYRDPDDPRHQVAEEAEPRAPRQSSHAAGIAPLLAYVPFVDPIPIHQHWLILLVPLCIVIAVVYKAIKIVDLKHLPREATVLALQIIAFMIVAAGGLWLLTEFA